MDQSNEIRTDEDRIIETLIIEGNDSIYEDLVRYSSVHVIILELTLTFTKDFLPTRQSLYNVENIIPEYDDEVAEIIE